MQNAERRKPKVERIGHGFPQMTTDFFIFLFYQYAKPSRMKRLAPFYAYGEKMVEMMGFEPTTPTLRTWCSPS